MPGSPLSWNRLKEGGRTLAPAALPLCNDVLPRDKVPSAWQCTNDFAQRPRLPSHTPFARKPLAEPCVANIPGNCETGEPSQSRVFSQPRHASDCGERPVEPISHFFYSDRLKLQFWDYGQDAKPSLVLVHGGLDHARNWDWVARVLCEHYHVYALDL